MKPSKRIQEIQDVLNRKFPHNNFTGKRVEALILYLDEEYEKQKEAVEELKRNIKPM